MKHLTLPHKRLIQNPGQISVNDDLWTTSNLFVSLEIKRYLGQHLKPFISSNVFQL